MPLPHYPVQINVKLIEYWQLLMVQDKRFPLYNDGVLIAVALEMLNEKWNTIVDQKSENRFADFHEEVMRLVKKLQKNGMVDPHARKIRSLEEVKNASK